MVNENFIRIYPKAFSSVFCDSIISYFNWCKDNNKTWGRSNLNIHKKDEACLINPTNIEELNFDWENIKFILEEFNNKFWDIYYAHYSEEFSVLKEFGTHSILTYKVQKTSPGGGYHEWHAEQDCREHSTRIATYNVYLNTVEEGGETEFLFQNKRIKAEKGDLCIFPASFSHTHRGNPPLSGDKYILTGWIEFN